MSGLETTQLPEDDRTAVVQLGVADRDRAALLASLAAELLARHFPQDAETVLRYALSLDPACFAAHFALAEALHMLFRVDEALAQGWLAYAVKRKLMPASFVALPEAQMASDRLSQPAILPDPQSLALSIGFAATQRPKEAWLLGLAGQLCFEAGWTADAVPWYRRAAILDSVYAPSLDASLAACRALPVLELHDVEDDAALRDALRRVPLPAVAAIRCETLSGGGENRIVKLTAGQRSFVLRLEKYLSLDWHFYAEEVGNAMSAHRAGLAPAIRYFDRTDGTQLTDYVAGPMMSSKSFADPAKAAEAGKLYRRLHAIEGFRGNYDILQMIERDRIPRGEFCPPDIGDLGQINLDFTKIRQLLIANKVARRATHNDPIPQNFLAADGGLVLLDWQCSAMGDPHWDIAAFSAQVALPDPAEQAFIAAYFDENDAIGRARFRLFKPVCSYFWLGRGLNRGAKSVDQNWHADVVQSAKRFREFRAEPIFAESMALLERSTSA